MRKKLKQVRIEDFCASLLRQAAREGRLYVRPSGISETGKLRQTLAAILQYVSSIDECASARYRGRVRSIWEGIVHNPDIRHSLVMHKGRNCGEPNKYRITALVTFMLNCGVYRAGEFSAVDLHLRLERATNRNRYYTSMDKYCPTGSERKTLRQIISSVEI